MLIIIYAFTTLPGNSALKVEKTWHAVLGGGPEPRLRLSSELKWPEEFVNEMTWCLLLI